MEKDYEKIKFARKVKRFLRQLGLRPTNNFWKIQNKDEIRQTNLLCIQKKNSMPFSYVDPKMSLHKEVPGTLEENIAQMKSEKINVAERDLWLYTRAIKSGGAKVSRAFLDESREDMAYIIAHEDWHDRGTGLPMHMEEASADLVGLIVKAKFFGKNVGATLAKRMHYASSVNACHALLRDLAEMFNGKEISVCSYSARKRGALCRLQKQIKCGEINPVWVAFSSTYTHYFPLLCRYFFAIGCDFERLCRDLVSLSVAVPNPKRDFEWSRTATEHFLETRRREKEIERRLRAAIKARAIKNNNA